MNDLHGILLVAAIEDSDRDGTMLPRADREQATRQALRQYPLEAGDLETGTPGKRALRALTLRSALLQERLAARFPVLQRLAPGIDAGRWLDVAALAMALLAGVSMAQLDASGRINILAFPLLGLVVWNLLVFGLLVLGALRRSADPAWLLNGLRASYSFLVAARLRTLSMHTSGYHLALAQALDRFAQEWGAVAGPLLLARARRLLHLAAALVAAGLVAGLYLRGIVFHYQAGWESTFLGPAQVKPLLDLTFGPAAAITGIPIPATPAGIEALRWTGPGSGVGAAPWIHLIAVTALIFIVLPRLLAALAAQTSLWRLATTPPLPPQVGDYARRAFGRSVGLPGHGIAAVTPHGGEPSATSRRALQELLLAALGDETTVDLRSAVRYGDEDAWLETLAKGAGRVADCHVLLFDLAATPETEIHGALLSGIRDWLVRAQPRGQLLVMVDESGFAARRGATGGLQPRLDERRALWRRFVAAHGLEAVFVNLGEAAATPGAPLASELRAALRTCGRGE